MFTIKLNMCTKVNIVLIAIALPAFRVVISERVLENVNKRFIGLETPWVWGTEDNVTEPIRARLQDENSTLSPVTTPTKIDVTNETNPCDPVAEPVKPNFARPGVRISEAKCYDYIWQIKNREDQHKNFLACRTYKNTRLGPFKPNFAIGGRDTTPGEFPHMGAIGWEAFIGTWVFKCGGSLISSKFVLTAAHCSKISSRDSTVADPVPKIVRLGDKNIADIPYNNMKPTDVNISRIILHPNYKSPKKYYDVALVELEKEVEFTMFIQPACLWGKFNTSSLGIEATLTGWGVIETAGLTTSPELKAAVVDIIDSKKCDELLQPVCNRLWCGIQDTQLCAGKLAGGVDACQGDSGGPLQVQIPLPITSQGKIHYIIGVTSFGFGCARPNTPGVYTRVSTVIDWVEEVVWPQNKSS